MYDGLRAIIEWNYVAIRRRIRRKIAELEPQKATMPATPTALDLPCGTGTFTSCFQPESYLGMDIDSLYVERARAKHPHHRFIVGDATALELEDASVRLVLIVGMLHHLSYNQCEATIAEVQRVLIPGGQLLLIEDMPSPPMNFIGRMLQGFDEGDNIRSPEAYRPLLEKHFIVHHHEPFASGFWNYCEFSCVKEY